MTDQPQNRADYQKEAQKVIEEKLLFINKAFESSGEAIGISNAQGQHIYQNQALSDLFGYATAEELQAAGGGAAVVYDPDVAKEMYGNIQNGRSWSGELQMVTKNGRVFFAYERADAIKDHEGKIIGLIGIVTDISARKKTEDLLRQSQILLKSSIESQTDTIMSSIDNDYRYLYFNKAHSNAMKYAYDQDVEIGMNILDCITSGEDKLAAKENYDRALSGESHSIIRVFGDANLACYESFFNPIKNDNDEIIGATGLVRNITDRINAEERLKDSEEQFKKAQAVGHVGSWEYDIRSDTFWGSDEGKRIYGFDLLSDNFTAEDLMKCAVDGEMVRQARLDLIEKDKPYNIVYEIIPRNSKEKRTINSIAELVRDKHGKPLKVTGVLIDITERKSCENDLSASNASLEKSEKKYRALFYTMTEGVAINEIIYNEKNEMVDYRVVEVNEKFYEITNTTPEQVINNVATQLYRMPGEVIKAFWEQHKYSNETAYAEMMSPVGDDRWFYISTSPFKDDKFVTVFFDITERKQSEKRIKLSSKILTLLNTATPFNETIKLIISYIQELYGFDAIGLRIKKGDDYSYFDQYGFSDSFLQSENTLIEKTRQGVICSDSTGKPCLECTCGLVIRGNLDPSNPLFTEGGSFFTNDSPVLLGLKGDQEPRHNPRNRCIHEGYQSVALIPIRNSGEIVGLLQFNDRKRDCFTPIMIKFFEGIGETVGLALTRKQTHEELEKSELEFRLLAESMPQIVWICSPDGGNIYFNHQWVEYTGLSLEESYGHGWNEPFHADDQQRAWVAWENAILHGAAYSLECRLRRVDGAYKWWLIRGVPVSDTNGEVVKWFGTCTDIDELKKKERELFHTKAILQGSMDQSQAGIAIADAPDGKLRYVNDAGLLIRGDSRQEMIESVGIDQYVASWKLVDFDGTPLKPDEVPLARAIMFGETNSREFIIRREVDDDRIVLAKAAPIRDESENIVAGIVVFLDITESKQSEIALKKSLAELKEFNSLMVGRELRMIELKKEINELLKRNGGEEKYDIPK